jgi:hypothetical protein
MKAMMQIVEKKRSP